MFKKRTRREDEIPVPENSREICREFSVAFSRFKNFAQISQIPPSSRELAGNSPAPGLSL